MGASFLDRTLDGTKTPSELQAWFDDASSQGAYENGNSYSGDWNMMRGLRIYGGPTFESLTAARDHIMKNTSKWESALAVRFKASHPGPLLFPTAGKEFVHSLSMALPHESIPDSLVMVALTSTPGTDGRKLHIADLGTPSQRERLFKLAVTLHDKGRTLRATRDHLDTAVKTVTAPSGTPDWALLKRARAAWLKALTAYAKALDAWKKVADPIYARRKTVDDGVKWLVGGWAAS